MPRCTLTCITPYPACSLIPCTRHGLLFYYGFWVSNHAASPPAWVLITCTRMAPYLSQIFSSPILNLNPHTGLPSPLGIAFLILLELGYRMLGHLSVGMLILLLWGVSICCYSPHFVGLPPALALVSPCLSSDTLYLTTIHYLGIATLLSAQDIWCLLLYHHNFPSPAPTDMDSYLALPQLMALGVNYWKRKEKKSKNNHTASVNDDPWGMLSYFTYLFSY